MATEYELQHDLQTKVWRRNLEPDDTLFSTAPGTDGLSVVSGDLSVDRGHWVELNASNKAVVAGVGANARGAMPVWSGGVDRKDNPGGITVVYGPHVAKTTGFDAAQSYSLGQELTLALDANGNAVLTPAGSGDVVVAVVEQTPAEVSTKFPDGLLQISTLGVGYTK